ncbi:hypothetical protein [Bizionia argentinensis]|uniref:hypothetical protein n=1 Tax=Bizionia argentinensis TaxID=456455 RepID=UPI0002231EFB|nr:hypothetical protein [Bizionia argentinensis]
MDIIKTIVEFFKKPEAETINESPQGVCSLCWGYQEYNGKIRQLFKDKQVDVNNHKDSYTLIQDFVKAHVDGYHIKDGMVHVCPNCGELESGKDRIEKYKLSKDQE